MSHTNIGSRAIEDLKTSTLQNDRALGIFNMKHSVSRPLENNGLPMFGSHLPLSPDQSNREQGVALKSYLNEVSLRDAAMHHQHDHVSEPSMEIAM